MGSLLTIADDCKNIRQATTVEGATLSAFAALGRCPSFHAGVVMRLDTGAFSALTSSLVLSLDADGFTMDRLFDASTNANAECVDQLDKFRDAVVKSIVCAPLPGLDGRYLLIAVADFVIQKQLRFVVEMVRLCLAMTVQRLEADIAAENLEMEAGQLAAEINEIQNDLRVSREISGT